MSEQTSSEHPSELLPWYVNGTLSDAERDSVASHVTTCESCQQEIAELKQLHARVKAIEEATQSPGELGLARLKRRIQSEASNTHANINTRTSRHWWLRRALAAAGIIIVLQAGLMWNMESQNRQQMHLLSGTSSADIQVLFTPDAPEAQIRALLQSVHGHIVDGPGAQGIYHIRIESTDNRESELEMAIQTLRKQSDIVRFAAKESD